MYQPQEGFDFPITLNSSDQLHIHQHNTKAEFVTTYEEKIVFGAPWGVTLKSLTFDNSILNYDGQERRPDEPMEEYTEEMTGGRRKPYLHPLGHESTDPINALPPVDVSISLSILEYHGEKQWISYPPTIAFTVNFKPDPNNAGSYDVQQACQDIQRDLALCEIYTQRDIPYITTAQSTEFRVYTSEGDYHGHGEPIYVENSWQSYSTPKNWLEYTVENIYLGFRRETGIMKDTRIGVNDSGFFYIRGLPNTRFALIQGREQTAEKFIETAKVFGLTPVDIHPVNLTGNTVPLEMDADGRSFACLTVPASESSRVATATPPVPMAAERPVPRGMTKYNFDDFDGVRVITTGTADYLVNDVPLSSVMNTTSIDDLLDLLLNDQSEKVKARVNDDGHVEIYHANPAPVDNSYVAICGPEGFLRDAFGYRSGEIVPSYFMHHRLREEINIANTRTYVFDGYPTFKGKPTELASEILTAHDNVDKPDTITWQMKQDSHMHLHGVEVFVYEGRNIFCDCPTVSLYNELFLDQYTSEISHRRYLMYAMQPKDTQADMNVMRLRDYKDTRDVVRDNDLSFSIRAYKVTPHKPNLWRKEDAEQVAGKNGYRLSLEVDGKLRGPACFKTHDMLLESFKTSVKIGLCSVLPSKYDAESVGNLHMDDIINISLDKSRILFLFTCGSKYDMVELAFSPHVGGLFGFSMHEDSMVRVYRGQLPVPSSVPQGGWWLHPNCTNIYNMKVEEEGRYPSNLDMGTGFVRVMSDLVGEVSLVNGRRQNMLGSVPLDWTKEGFDGKSPATSTYLPINKREVGQISIRLEDQNGELVNFLGNNQRPVEIELVCSGMRN